MQGVQKNNDLLLRVYFSFSNPAKNLLLTMLQKLYRTLEMNFQDENERGAMAQFARTGVYDFVEENLSEPESDSEVCALLRLSEEEGTENEADSEEKIVAIRGSLDEDEDQIELEKSMI